MASTDLGEEGEVSEGGDLAPAGDVQPHALAAQGLQHSTQPVQGYIYNIT
jgi:hypothetical protein